MTRSLMGFGVALATAACSLGALTVSAPAASAATAICTGSGLSSSLASGQGSVPTGGTRWKIPRGCGSEVDIQLTQATRDSYLGLLYDTTTGTWVACHEGVFQKWQGSVLTLCTSVLATTKFAVIQESSTHRSISVSY